MLAIIGCASVPNKGFFKKFIKMFRREAGITVQQIRVYGAPVLHIIVKTEKDIKPRVLEKRLHAAGRVIRRAGNLSVCFTKDFKYTQYFMENGFIEPDLTDLYETLAHKAVKILPCETKTAFFTASRMNSAAQDTLTALCGRFRYVMTDVKSGGEEFLQEIQRSLGISVISHPAPAQMLEADAAFFFKTGKCADTVILSDNCVVYAADLEVLSCDSYKRCVTALDIEVKESFGEKIFDEFPKEALIANALRNMSLTPDSLTLRTVTVSTKRGLPVFKA